MLYSNVHLPMPLWGVTAHNNIMDIGQSFPKLNGKRYFKNKERNLRTTVSLEEQGEIKKLKKLRKDYSMFVLEEPAV